MSCKRDRKLAEFRQPSGRGRGAERPRRADCDGVSGDQSKRSNERREELRNYELSSKTISTVSEGYKIENLTVAVVINRKRLMASLGDAATPEAVDKQVKEIQALVEFGNWGRCQARRPCGGLGRRLHAGRPAR